MSNLLNKIKSSPTPKGQIRVFDYTPPQTVRLKNKLKSFVLYAGITAAVIFTAYNIHAYNKSFDNCLRLLEQIEVNSAILDQEVHSLRVQMGAADDK